MLVSGVLSMLSSHWKMAPLLLVLVALGAAQATRTSQDASGGLPELSAPPPRVVAPAGLVSLEVPARTAYDPDTLAAIRPRFDAYVERVFVVVGQRVYLGD